MKKKGFTLVELLAVIAVLAIIAIITVPIISNVVEKSKKEAFKDDVLNAFHQVDYYLIKNNLGVIPDEGISVTDIDLKSNKFESGIFVKNGDGDLEAINVTDGKYCADGEMTNLKVYKGECKAVVPTITIVVNEKIATIILEDSLGLAGYVIATVEEEPTEWTIIENTKKEELTYEATAAGTYYVYAQNTLGKTTSSSFEIDASLFNYEATAETSTYTATDIGHKHTGNSSSGGGCYTNKKTGTTTHICTVTNGAHSVSINSDGTYAWITYSSHSLCGQGKVTTGYATKNTWGSETYGTSTHSFSSSYTYYELGCGLSETTEYSCPDGGELDGTTCIVTTYSCPNGGTLNGTICELQ